jgi:hypothetical protein
MAKPVIVVGDGWGALSSVAHLLSQDKGDAQEIIWLAGSVSRALSPLPTVHLGFAKLARHFGVEIGDRHVSNGRNAYSTYLREFKNKAFREPTFSKGDSIEQALEENLWGPEQKIALLTEDRFELSAAEIEESLRAKIRAAEFSHLRRIEGNAFAGVKTADGSVQTVVLASGEEFECERVIFCDRWSLLPKIHGLPKGLSFTRSREPHGLLQATFNHAVAVGVGVLEGFFATMNREAGEEFDRHVWGYFSADGKQSFWTICLATTEVEDNHEIAKKLRRMKSTLDKMFTGASWIPHAEKGFMANVSDEQVRFEESLIFAEGKVPTEIIGIEGAENLNFVTDGYGPANAFEQVLRLLGTTSALDVEIPVSEVASSSSESANESVHELAHEPGFFLPDHDNAQGDIRADSQANHQNNN